MDGMAQRKLWLAACGSAHALAPNDSSGQKSGLARAITSKRYFFEVPMVIAW